MADATISRVRMRDLARLGRSRPEACELMAPPIYVYRRPLRITPQSNQSPRTPERTKPTTERT
jgi:hypothetical protein